MSSEKLKEFDEFYRERLKPALARKYLTEPSDSLRLVIDRFDRMIDYNVPHGKKMRGLCTYESLVGLLEAGAAVGATGVARDRLIEQAKAIGWCIEFLQGSFLVADDIMDNSTVRRGQKCWYLNDNVGSVAINDAFYLLACVFSVINEFARDHPMYVRFYELFNQTFTETVIGQGLDLITPPSKEYLASHPFDFANYTEERYLAIVTWKTAFYSFCLPVQSALLLAGIDDPTLHARCRAILLDMGVYFQIQDDFLDNYGDPALIGKIGTDIEEGKCGWLVVQALKRASPAQMATLGECYGRAEPERVARVKRLYDELELRAEFERFEEAKHAAILQAIGRLELPGAELAAVRVLLTNFVNKIFKRRK